MATAVKQPQLDTPVFNSSMARQSVMNGNFDVWQRANTKTNPVTGTFLADRWKIIWAVDGGTAPTSIIHSRQAITGDLYNSFSLYRISPNGAGSGFGTNSGYYIQQRIEHATKLLCGLNKKVTLSFWARSSIANKRIGVGFFQYYGTGGSPSAQETIRCDAFTLTSNWTKYTVTVTTNTLVGKTFGTVNDDHFAICLWEQWGATYGDTYIKSGLTAESWVGSGDIDIAQVQLCAGDVALPFEPKSYQEEYLNCLRYCYCQTTPAAGYLITENGYANSATHAYPCLTYPVPMRRQPNIEFDWTTATDWQLADGVNAAVDVTAVSVNNSTNYRMLIDFTASGLTAYRMYVVVSDSGGARTFSIEAEM
jgi:hypothetical protein